MFQGRLRFSQVSCEPLVHLPCSQTPAGPPRQAHGGVSVLPSHSKKSKAPTNMNTFEAQSHGFCTDCLRFVPPSRTTTQNSLPVVSQTLPGGFSHPTEFGWRVSAIAFPSPRAFLGAIRARARIKSKKASGHRGPNLMAVGPVLGRQKHERVKAKSAVSHRRA